MQTCLVLKVEQKVQKEATISEKTLDKAESCMKWDLWEALVGCFVWWPVHIPANCAQTTTHLSRTGVNSAEDKASGSRGLLSERLSLPLILESSEGFHTQLKRWKNQEIEKVGLIPANLQNNCLKRGKKFYVPCFLSVSQLSAGLRELSAWCLWLHNYQ